MISRQDIEGIKAENIQRGFFNQIRQNAITLAAKITDEKLREFGERRVVNAQGVSVTVILTLQ